MTMLSLASACKQLTKKGHWTRSELGKKNREIGLLRFTHETFCYLCDHRN